MSHGLTDEQLFHFRVFGFVRINSLLSPCEVLDINLDLLSTFRRERGDRIYDGTWRHQLDAVVEHSSVLSPLVTDSRVLVPIIRLLGPAPVWIGSDANLYVEDTGWHPDGSNLSYRRVKALFYLQPLSSNSGALRVIPGSHVDPLHTGVNALLQRTDQSITPYGVVAPLRDLPQARPFATDVRDLPSFSIDTAPGDVVLFDQNIWHSSYRGHAGRAMFTLNYGEDPRASEHVEYLKAMYSGQLEFCLSGQHAPFTSLFPDAFARANTSEITSLLRVARQLGYDR